MSFLVFQAFSNPIDPNIRVFSILFSIHFLKCSQGEFVSQSRDSLFGDHFLYSHDLNVWFVDDIVRRY